MLQSAINSNKWKKDVMRKLTSFADKCPLWLSINTGIYKGMDGVFIKVNGSENKYFFKFDIGSDEKKFIHQIKMKLLPEYPTLVSYARETRHLTADEIADYLSQGKMLSDIPKVVQITKSITFWRIEKVLPWRQTFFLCPLKKVDSNGQPLEVEEGQYKYHYNNSSILFLKKYRTKEFVSIEEASENFFNNSELLGIVGIKTE